MKKSIWILALVLSPMMLPSEARAWFPPRIQVDAGFNAWFNVRHTGWESMAGPWYLYWPQDAHYRSNVPPGAQYPHWPSQWPPRSSAPGQGGSRAPGQAPFKGKTPFPRPLGYAPSSGSHSWTSAYQPGYVPAPYSYHYRPVNYGYGR